MWGKFPSREPSLWGTSKQGGRSWRASGDHQISLTALAQSACLQIFATKTPYFTIANFCNINVVFFTFFYTRESLTPLSWSWQGARMQGWAGMTFGDLGTGTGMAQPIPKLWEREREWKISFPTFGNGNGKIPFPIFGNGNGNSIPAFREREWDIVIPGNDREWERELHRKIEWQFFIIPIFNPTNILHCNRTQICP